MKRKGTLVFLIVFNALTLVAGDRIDSLLNQLTIHQKINLLFIEQPDAAHLDSVLVAGQTLVFDTRMGVKDELALPYPNEQTIRAVTDPNLKKELFTSVLHTKRLLGYKAIIVPDEHKGVARLFAGDQTSTQAGYHFRVVDFPCELIERLISSGVSNRTNANKKGSFDVKALGLPSFSIWSASDGIVVDLEQLMNFNFVFWRQEDTDCLQLFAKAVEMGFISEEGLNRKVRALLEELYSFEKETIRTVEAFNDLELRSMAYKKSIAIYQKKRLFPINRLDSVNISVSEATVTNPEEFRKKVEFYKGSLNDGNYDKQLHFLLCDNDILLSKALDELEASSYDATIDYVLVYVSNIEQSKLRRAIQIVNAVVLMPEATKDAWSLAAQAVFSGIDVEGFAGYNDFLVRNGYKRFESNKSRLGFQQSGLSVLPTDSIAKIDSIINDAMRKEAMPGAQLMVVKSGNVVLQKNYGYHSYRKRQEVRGTDLYDIASITKLAVTFPVIMQLYEKGALSLDATLDEYLPGIDTTDKAGVTIRELLLHQSGLVSYIPFHTNALNRESLGKHSLYSRHYSRLYNIRVDTRLYQNRQARFRKDVFSNEQDDVYSCQLTDHMFMNQGYVDSMYTAIYTSKLSEKKEYRYSDLGYYLLQRIIENEEGNRIDSLFYRQVSKPLSAQKLVYCPLSSFDTDQIIPTENDRAFRREQLDGYVHDQGAAMFGGVAAHAGLFANAGDLAKLSQMLLNEGTYGGIRFFESETVGLFTQAAGNGNRRGLGVDKPELNSSENTHVSKRVSPTSYGHTGFTGTILWIDPEYELIYIFLSNRIHPNAYNKKLIEMNVRTQIQDVIYNSIQY